MNIDDLQIALEYFCANRKDYIYYNQIKQHLDAKGTYSIIDVLLIIRKLARDGFVLSEEQEHTHYSTKRSPITELVDGYFITFEGLVFFEQGGYKKQKELKEKKASDKKDAHNLDISLKRNQKRVNIWNVALTVISAIFIGFSAWFQFSDRTDEEIGLLRKQVQESTGEIRRIDTSLREINLSIRHQRTDTAIIKVLRNKP